MTADDLEAFLRGLSLTVEMIIGDDGATYTAVLGYTITGGALAGRICDVAVQRVETVPYVVPAAIHTRPHLVPMDGAEPLKTMDSPIGSEWQYWSRRYDREAEPRKIWTHVITILTDDRWPTS
jgi:hypothetical protein